MSSCAEPSSESSPTTNTSCPKSRPKKKKFSSGTYCKAYGCKSAAYINVEGKKVPSKISFFMIPKKVLENKNTLKHWAALIKREIGRDNFTLGKNSALCEKHFKDSDILWWSPNGLRLRRPRLKEGAAPVLHSWVTVKPERPAPKQRECPPPKKFKGQHRLNESLENASCELNPEEELPAVTPGKTKSKEEHVGDKPFMCEECGYRTADRSNLSVHMRKHTVDKLYKCDQCDFAAALKSVFKKHTDKHTKPYMCGHCGYRTSHRSNLSRHMKKHTGERPYKCEHCDYSATQKSDLHVHILKHTGEKPYMCGECGYRASQKLHLSNHMMKRHDTGEKPYKCDLCDFSAFHSGLLSQHMIKHVEEKLYMCGECGLRTGYMSILSAHMKSHLGKNPSDIPFTQKKTETKVKQSTTPTNN